MKLSIRIIEDSWNSYPREEIEFRVSEDMVTFNTDNEDGDERKISVDRAEFMVLLKILQND